MSRRININEVREFGGDDVADDMLLSQGYDEGYADAIADVVAWLRGVSLDAVAARKFATRIKNGAAKGCS